MYKGQGAGLGRMQPWVRAREQRGVGRGRGFPSNAIQKTFHNILSMTMLTMPWPLYAPHCMRVSLNSFQVAQEMCDHKRFCARNCGAQVRSTKHGSTGTKTATRHTGLLAKARPRSGTRISTAASMLLRSRAAPRQAHARVACPATAAAHTCGGLGWSYYDERARVSPSLTSNASRFPQQIEALFDRIRF